MKTINRIFFQIIALTMIMSAAVSNAFAQQEECIKAYMVQEESCNPGSDGIAAITIPSALASKCIVEWQLPTGVSNDLVVSGLSEGTYSVTVKSNVCTSVVFFNGYVDITRDEACKIKVTVAGPTYVEGTCNEIPSITFTATAEGGVPPYTFHGWTQVNSTTATRTVSPSGGAFVVSCYVSDSTGHYGADELHGYAKKMECAKDPNEIKGPDGYSEEKHFVNNTNKMNYTIDFENDPDFAMAPASRVTITYDVPAQQDIRTFRLADFGFGNFVFTVPSNVSAYSQRLDVSDSLGVWVDVTAGINVANRQLFWTFQSIDPATGAEPASSQMGFLPINDSLSHGEGYVSFYIAPDANVQTGDTVGAEALIVFDDNAPIGTNVWTNTFDVVAPTSTLYAQMDAEDSLYCSFTFEVQDDPNGSGVQSVEVYMSANNADYVSIGSTDPDSTLSLALENGVYYQFMSIATDNVGNKEAFKAVADTLVNYNTAPIDIVLNGNVFYEYDPANTQIGVLYTMDNDVNLPFVYELVNGDGDDDNALFVIDGNNLRTDTTFVCGHKTEYSVRVRSTDIGGLYIEKIFTLNEILQHETPVLRLSKTICQGESIDFYGRELTDAGIYVDTLSTELGCDSIIVWYLNVNPSYNNTPIDTIVCDQFVWNDSTYTVSTVINYTYTLSTGCDSTITYNLTVNHSSEGVDEQIVCDSLTWIDGVTYYESTSTPTFVYPNGNAVGCDSTVTLHLTVKHSSEGDTTAVVCGSFDWYEHVGLVQSGDYVHTFVEGNSEGCDSVVTLHLTVNPPVAMNSVYDQVITHGSWIEGVTFSSNLSEGEMSYAWIRDNEENVTGLLANGTGNIDAVALGNLTNMAQTTTFTVTPTHTLNGISCDGESISFTVTVNPQAVMDGVDNQFVCSGSAIDEVTFTTSLTDGNMTYEWNRDNTENVTGLDANGTGDIDAVVLTNQTDMPQDVTFTVVPTYSNNGISNIGDAIMFTVTVYPNVTGDTSAVVCDSFDWYEQTNITESSDYTRVFPSQYGCDSTVTLHLTVNYGTHNVYDTIVCESYEWHEHLYTESGIYTYEYTNDNDCASVDTLRLTVNYGTHNVYDTTVCESYEWHELLYTESGTYTYEYTNDSECASVDTLLLTVNYGTHNVYDTTVCEGYEWHEHLYTESGTYTYEYTNDSECTSVDTLRLTVNYGTHNVYDTIVCESYEWHEHLYTESGTYTYEYTNDSECASVDTLRLTVNYGTHNVYDTIVCESYEWHEHLYTETGTYTYEYYNAAGCASVDTLRLTVNYSSEGVDEQIVCDSLTWIDEITYYESTNIPTFTIVGGAFNGCDSVVTLHLTVKNTAYGDTSAVACGSFVWHGVEYTETPDVAPTYTMVGGASNDCDSIVTLHLTVNNPAFGDTIVTTCESFTWHEVEYTETPDVAPTYTYENGAANGCDSTVTLHLTINHPTEGIDVREACNSFTWIDGVTYTESTTTPVYTIVEGNAGGCDSTVTLHLTITDTVHVYLNVDTCESYAWYGVTYNESGVYEHYFNTYDGCDSVEVLNLTIHHANYNSEIVTVCNSYEWYGEIYTESGTYIHHYANTFGCASVDTLYLTVNYATHNVVDTAVCEGFEWHEQLYTESGTYTFEYTNANDCPSADTLHLTVNHGTYNVYDTIVCESYEWHEQLYTESGTYIYEYTNTTDCASADTLHLTVNQPAIGIDEQEACDSLTWLDEITYYESTNTPTFTIIGGAANGCDSIVTLHLTVNHVTTGVDVQEACNSFTWIDGVTYTESTDDTNAPTFILSSVAGCDSIVTLHLTITDTVHVYFNVDTCESYVWYGETYNQSGVYERYFTTLDGCDSVEVLTLTINHATTGIDMQEACESFTWIDGVTYTESTIGAIAPTYILSNTAGCDSVVTLQLTINHGTHNVETEISCETYSWHGQDYTASGTYTYSYANTNGCPSADTLYLTINHGVTGVDEQTACDSYAWIDGTVYTESTNTPTYTYAGAAANGCDSTVTLHLTINESVSVEYYLTINESDLPYTFGDTTFEPGTVQSGDYSFYLTTVDGCDSIIVLHLTVLTGIEDHYANAAMNVYPNPTNNKVNVQFTMYNEQLGDAEIQLYDMYGKWLRTWKVTGETTEIDLSPYAASVYFIKVVDDQHMIGVRKVVKE